MTAGRFPAPFHACTQRWFTQAFGSPTRIQTRAWPVLQAGGNALLLAPTGSGKTLAAFLAAIDRVMFGDPPAAEERGVRVLYVSPLKALGVDVDRNLRAPIAGLLAEAERSGLEEFRLPSVAVRSGDTTPQERRQIQRFPPDILITTPESLYLLLTSQASRILGRVETVIVDEIHAVVGTKRGAHLLLSLERLERLRRQSDSAAPPLQRIGLSATQRPLEEIARALAGGECAAEDGDGIRRERSVEIIDAGEPKQFDLRVEVPVEDMARLAEQPAQRPGNDVAREGGAEPIPSIWPAIYPRLVELVRGQRSTMIFVNSRRLAERLAQSLNDLAGEELALAHHGSISKDQRLQIEDRLKRGDLPAIVATSSLELGIDMGAVELVIQIEAPPSIAAGVQRIGRSGHRIGEPSTGVVFPKFRGDLLPCAAVTACMREGRVEETRYLRNPLDVLAQQIVAIVARETLTVDALYALVRCAAPFAELPRSSFEGVLDLLAGRYPSSEFAELRARINWDRVQGTLSARRSSQRIAVLNAGTIPDRGLYGVFLANDDGESASRVGELDEEMVFEMQPGDVFLLGASSWRVLDITRDRVLVAPAPGEPGRMPFWRGDGPGRPLEFGAAIGRLARELTEQTREEAVEQLVREHALDERAARNLVDYLADQQAATGGVPSDRRVIVESFVDEVGDWRVAVLSPFGSRVHAPWAMAIAAALREYVPGNIDFTWGDDGMLFRLPETDNAPETGRFLPGSETVEGEIVEQLSSTALFAARFRENAARALLLPRRDPQRRRPLWLQRRKSADLLAVAARYPSFPLILETYRECLQDVFDMPGLVSILRGIEAGEIEVAAVQTATPSPFASALLFSFTGNFLYSGDAPLAERRAQALALDQTQLRELLGTADLRDLLDADVVRELGRELQRLDGKRTMSDADDLHDLLLSLGPLTREELVDRVPGDGDVGSVVDGWLQSLSAARSVFEFARGASTLLAAAEDAARLRDAAGVVLPEGLPATLLEPVEQPAVDLVARYARTHGPFHVERAAAELGLAVADVQEALKELSQRQRVYEGAFLPAERAAGGGSEWCDAGVLRTLKRRSLQRLRQQIQPVAPQRLQQFVLEWQGVSRPRRGMDGILDTVEQLQGLALPASVWEAEILPARVKGYRPADLDELCAAGEIVWQGADRLGTNDGRIALFLTDQFGLLAQESGAVEDPTAAAIRALLAERGAVFYDELVRAIGGFPQDVFDALWDLVWAGEVTNDTLAPLRSLRRGNARTQSLTRWRSRRAAAGRPRQAEPGAEGRWSLLEAHRRPEATPTERQAALAAQLLERYGLVTRETVGGERIAGGFSALYPVFKAMEDAGRIRRGYFVEGLGAAQFAAAGADDRLRGKPAADVASGPVMLAATDPANLYGAVLSWPATGEGTGSPQRAAGARVILSEGRLLGYLGRAGVTLATFLPEEEAEFRAAADAVAETLADRATAGRSVLLEKIDGAAGREIPLRGALERVGFRWTSRGWLHRGPRDRPLEMGESTG